MTPPEQRDDAEGRRRALYRPGADAEQVRRYLESRPVAEATVPPTAARTTTPAPEPSMPVGARASATGPRQVGAVVLAILVLAAVPAAVAPGRLAPLPVPAAGDFSRSQAVTISPAARAAALAGRARLWSAIEATAPFARRGGRESFSGTGSGPLRRGIDPVPLAATAHHVVTIFVACEGTAADVGLGSEAEDFGGTSSFSLNDTRVPCGGVRMVRYRPPAGLLPTSIALSVPDGRRIAYSVVGGF